jgi:soluble lytic murein transglycosylase
MMCKRLVLVLGLFACVYGLTIVLAAAPARADIYCYVDSKGVLHFSNVPTSPEYQIYLGETRAVRAYDPSSRYDSYIAQAARRYGVSFSLIKAIIKVESNFDPHAVSGSGARGLMQIMPRTAKALGVRDCFDPRENIFGGVRYLRALMTQFQHRLPLALAAYNAGPDRVDALKEVPPIDETQRFVRKVMKYYNGAN